MTQGHTKDAAPERPGLGVWSDMAGPSSLLPEG